MKVDPNAAVDQHQEMILCEHGDVVIRTGERTPLGSLEGTDSHFMRHCRSLDPNLCFFLALVPDDADREVFFRARDAARSQGFHMQAPLESPDRLQSMWAAFRQAMSGRPVAGDATVEDPPE